MQKRNIDDDEIILVEDKRDRFFLTQDHNGRKSIIKGGWIGDSQTQYMLIKQYFLQRNGKYTTKKSQILYYPKIPRILDPKFNLLKTPFSQCPITFFVETSIFRSLEEN